MSSTTPLSLSELAEDYRHWRATRRSAHGETPEYLQQQTIALLGHYRISEVINTLGLSHKMLKRWRQRWGRAQVDEQRDEHFVVLPTKAPESADQPTAQPLELKLSHQRSDGSMVSIEAQLTPQQWQSVLALVQPVQA